MWCHTIGIYRYPHIPIYQIECHATLYAPFIYQITVFHAPFIYQIATWHATLYAPFIYQIALCHATLYAPFIYQTLRYVTPRYTVPAILNTEDHFLSGCNRGVTILGTKILTSSQDIFFLFMTELCILVLGLTSSQKNVFLKKGKGPKHDLGPKNVQSSLPYIRGTSSLGFSTISTFFYKVVCYKFSCLHAFYIIWCYFPIFCKKKLYIAN